MKYFIAMLGLAFLGLSSCSSITSVTTIKPNDSFIQGNNAHGKFQVKLKNISKNVLEVYHTPINGGMHSSQNTKSNEAVLVKVDKNNTLVIANKSNDTTSVELKVTGDTGLSMGYKN